MPDPVRCAACGAIRPEMPPDWLPHVDDSSAGICVDCLRSYTYTARREAEVSYNHTYNTWLTLLVNNALYGPQRADEQEQAS